MRATLLRTDEIACRQKFAEGEVAPFVDNIRPSFLARELIVPHGRPVGDSMARVNRGETRRRAERLRPGLGRVAGSAKARVPCRDLRQTPVVSVLPRTH